ncbi:hypothetical protein [Cytobacillus oceanisediminis]|uniref:hypothetical protein n=1 Tax=Cytobacillus oceanisediminis TaxID=665099 RepID=UPI00030042A3|nr:hypothetical protein [Cytobacillus oceanisediminis]
MFDKGSTAVLSTPNLPFIVAVKQAGIYSFEDGDWFLQYGLTQNIYKLVQLGDFIFGIGGQWHNYPIRSAAKKMETDLIPNRPAAVGYYRKPDRIYRNAWRQQLIHIN